MEPESVYLERPELLDLPYFWRALFARPLGNSDSFDDATKHFGFRCTNKRPREFVSLAEQRVNLIGDQHVSHFAFLTTPSKWRFGRTFHDCPEDNTISFDIVSPDGKRICMGSDWGHFFLPAFRYSEVEKITGVFRRRKDKAKALLMLLPGIGGDNGIKKRIVPAVLNALTTLDFATKHTEQLAEHLVDECFWSVEWNYDRSLGWTNDSNYTFRQTKSAVCCTADELKEIKRFFRSLA